MFVRSWFGTVAAIASTAILLSGCGSSPPANDASTAVDCATKWQRVREQVVESGLPDGEARRQADLARADCEGIPVEDYPEGALETPTQDPVARCASEEERKNAPPPSDETKIAVYFSCIETMGTPDQPLYMFERDVPPDQRHPEARVLVAVSEYLLGPTEQETSEGYMTGFGASVKDVIKSVVIEGDHITIDFAASIERHVPGTTTANDVLIRELTAIATQFQGFRTLDLLLEGDCERFWKLMERECKPVTR